MTIEDIQRKNEVLIQYLKSLTSTNNFEIKAEYSTNDNDKKVIVVQETTGDKIVFFGDCPPLYNYYSIQMFGDSIAEVKKLSVNIGNLIGQSVRFPIQYTDLTTNKTYNELWQFIFMQFSNPQAIEYQDIRRVGYTSTLKCIVNLVRKTEI